VQNKVKNNKNRIIVIKAEWVATKKIKYAHISWSPIVLIQK